MIFEWAKDGKGVNNKIAQVRRPCASRSARFNGVHMRLEDINWMDVETYFGLVRVFAKHSVRVGPTELATEGLKDHKEAYLLR